MSATECRQAPQFKLDIPISVGDSRTQSYVRELEDGSIEKISCSNPDFDNKIVVPIDTPMKIQEAADELISKCAAWK